MRLGSCHMTSGMLRRLWTRTQQDSCKQRWNVIILYWVGMALELKNTNDQQLIAQLTADKRTTHTVLEHSLVHKMDFSQSSSLLLLCQFFWLSLWPFIAIAGWMVYAPYSQCPPRGLLPLPQLHWFPCCHWPSAHRREQIKRHSKSAWER